MPVRRWYLATSFNKVIADILVCDKKKRGKSTGDSLLFEKSFETLFPQ
jgi:hypothetical protein